jgi:zinc D-Ala-D-Ala carboxypeptidase
MKHFNISEFDSPDSLGSGKNMNPKFLEMLDEAREIAGVPFHITSGYRTIAHNKKVKGKSNSSHLKGYSADILVFSDTERWRIFNALMKVGFNRIGIAKTFIHCDNDPSKPVNVIWIY